MNAGLLFLFFRLGSSEVVEQFPIDPVYIEGTPNTNMLVIGSPSYIFVEGTPTPTQQISGTVNKTVDGTSQIYPVVKG